MDDLEKIRERFENMSPLIVENDIPASLHQFFMPQIEQLSLNPVRHLNGLSAEISSNGYGGFWTTNIGDNCLFTRLDLTLFDDVKMENALESYYCIGVMSANNTAMTPIQRRSSLKQENLISYKQDEGFQEYKLKHGSRYTSRSICFTENYFQELSRRNPHEAELLRKYLALPTLNELPYEVIHLLQSVNASDADKPSTTFRMRSVVNGVVACILDWLVAEENALAKKGGIFSKRLVEEARGLISRNLDKRLTLDAISRDLNVCRSSLSAIFKQETGQSVGAYVRSMRMQRAAKLLRKPGMSVAEVGAAVGYPRLSSFSTAFKQHFGVEPSQFRKGSNKQN